MDNQANIGLSANIDTSQVKTSLAELRGMLEKLEDVSMKPGRFLSKGLAQGLKTMAALTVQTVEAMEKTLADSQTGLAKAAKQAGAAATKAMETELKDLQSAQAKALEVAARANEKAWEEDRKAHLRMLNLKVAAEKKAQDEIRAEAERTAQFRARSASRMTEDDTRALLGMPSRDEMASLKASLKAQMLEAVSTGAMKARSASRMTEDDTRALLGMPSRDEMASLKASLKAQMLEAVDSAKLKARSASRMTEDDTRALLGMPSRKEMEGLKASLKSQMEAAAAAVVSARAQVNQAMQAPGGSYSVWNAGATGGRFGTVVSQPGPKVPSATSPAKSTLSELAQNAKDAIPHVKALAGHTNDLHSAARGVASGFNAMWLTWGNILPLLAGAGFSNLLVQTAKLGTEFDSVVTSMGALGEVGGFELNKLSKAALELSSSSKFGPLELVNGLKTLTLAGLDAREALQALPQVMNFSTVSEMPLDKAAESILGISKAFGYSAQEVSVAGDVVSKAAAISMSSVSDMTEAFKQSSVVAQQFGVTIQDQSVTLALLSNLGIKGSAAGTAVRNMYNELMGSSKKARQVLEQTLKIDIFDNATKAMKPLPTIMSDLFSSLSKYDFKGQMQILQQLGNERGMKALAADLQAMAAEAKRSGKDIGNLFAEIRQQMEDAPGFAAQAAAGMAASTQNIMKQVPNALQSSLIQAFDEMSPYLVNFSLQLRDMLNSEEFKSAVASIIRGVGDLVSTLVNAAKSLYEHKDAVLLVLEAYVGFKIAQVVVSQMLSLVEASAAVSSALKAQAVATTAVGTALTGFSAAAATANVALGAVGLVLTIAAAGWAAYQLSAGSAAAEMESASERAMKASQEALKADSNRLAVMQGSVDKELERLRLFIKNRGEEKKAAEEAQAAEAQRYVQKLRSEAEVQAALLERTASTKEAAAADAILNNPDTAGAKALQYQEEAKQLREQAKHVRDVAGAQILAYNASLELLRKRAKIAAEIANTNAGKGRLPTGSSKFDPDSLDKTAKGLKLAHDNEMQQIAAQYADKLSLIGKLEGDRQKLLKASYDAQLIGQVQFSISEVGIAEQAEQAKLAVINESEKAYAEAYQRTFDSLVAQYDGWVAENQGKKNFAERQSEEFNNLQQAIKNLGQSAETEFKKFAGNREEVKDGAVTRITLQAIKAQGEIQALRRTYEEFLLAEQKIQSDRANESAPVDLFRFWSVEAAAAYIKARADETKRLTSVVEDYRKQIRDLQRQLDETDKAFEGDIMTPTQVDMYLQQMEKLAELKKIMASVEGSVFSKADAEGVRALQNFWKEEQQRLSGGVADAIVTGLFEGGQAGKKKLRDLILAELRKPITLVIQAIVQPVVGSLMQSAGMSALGNPLGSLGSSFLGAGGLGATTSAFGTGLSAAWGGADLSAAIAAYTEAGMTGVAGGLSAGSILGAIPGWGWAAAALVALISSLDDSGTMHTGGLGSYSAKGGTAVGDLVKSQSPGFFNLNPADYQTSSETASVALAKSIVGILDSTAGAFGKSAGYYAATAFADDSSDSGAWGSLLVKIGDKVVTDWGPGGSGYLGKEFADGQAGAAEYSAAVAKDVRDYLVSQVPAWAADTLKALGDTPTLDQLAATVTQINSAAAALTTLSKASQAFANVSESASAALIKALGGAEASAATLSSYYGNFYSESERTALATEKLKSELSALGVTMPTTRDGFRALVDAAIAAGDPELAAKLISLGSAFAELTPAVADAAAAAEQAAKDRKAAALEQLRASVETAKTYWQQQADVATSLKNEVQGVFDVLTAAIKELRTSAAGPLTSAPQGNAFLDQAAQAAAAGGSLPDQAALSDAINAAKGGLDVNNFATIADQKFAQLQLAGKLDLIRSVAGEQLSYAESMLNTAKSQLADLDKTLKYWEDQVNLTQQTVDATMSVEQAVRDLISALTGGKDNSDSTSNPNMPKPGTVQAGRESSLLTLDGIPDSMKSNYAKVGDRYVYVGPYSMADSSSYYAGRLAKAYYSPEADMRSTWEQLTSSLFAGSPDALISAAKAAGLDKSVIESYVKEFYPSYDVGTNYVPADGPAFLHRGEKVIPAGLPYDPDTAPQRSDPAVVAKLDALCQEMAFMRETNAEMSRHTRRTAEAVNGNPEAPMLASLV